MTRSPVAGKVLLIYNPNAGHGRAKRLLPEIKAYFRLKQIDIETRVTEYPGHAVEISAETDFSKFVALVAAGGDGTLFEVVNGCFQNAGKGKLPIGILPVGTGNSFVKDLGLEANQWREAIDRICLNQPRKVDVAQCSTGQETFYFVNIMGLGFVTDVQEAAVRFKGLGNIAYTLGVLLQLFSLKAYAVQLELDEKKVKRSVALIEISNTRYTARNFLMAPSAQFDDGFLDVTLGANVSRVRLLSLFRKVFSGQHVEEDEIETFQVKRIRIHSDKPLKLGPDGEIRGRTPVEIVCLPGAIEVFG